MLTIEVAAEVQKMIVDVEQAIEQARRAFERGDASKGRSIMQARANDILRMAVLTDDEDVRLELVLLYEAVRRVEEVCGGG